MRKRKSHRQCTRSSVRENKDDSQLHILLPKRLKPLHQIHHKPGGCAAVNDAVIIRKGNWQYETRLHLVPVHDWFHRAPTQTQDGHLGLIYNRREMPATDATLVGNREYTAFELFG